MSFHGELYVRGERICDLDLGEANLLLFIRRREVAEVDKFINFWMKQSCKPVRNVCMAMITRNKKRKDRGR